MAIHRTKIGLCTWLNTGRYIYAQGYAHGKTQGYMYMAKHRANNHREIYIYNLKGLINNTGLGVCTSPWTLSNKVSMHKAVSQGYTQNYAMHKTGLDGCDYHRAIYTQG